jgi:hypothetical protein
MTISTSPQPRPTAQQTLKDIGLTQGLKFYGDIYKAARKAVVDIGNTIWKACKPHLGKIAAGSATAAALGTGVATVGVSGMAAGGASAVSTIGASLPYIAAAAGTAIGTLAAPGLIRTVGGWVREGFDKVTTTVDAGIKSVRECLTGYRDVCKAAIAAGKEKNGEIKVAGFNHLVEATSASLLAKVEANLEADGLTENEKALLKLLEERVPVILNSAGEAASQALQDKQRENGNVPNKDLAAAREHIQTVSQQIFEGVVEEYNTLASGDGFNDSSTSVPNEIVEKISGIAQQATEFSLAAPSLVEAVEEGSPGSNEKKN